MKLEKINQNNQALPTAPVVDETRQEVMGRAMDMAVPEMYKKQDENPGLAKIDDGANTLVKSAFEQAVVTQFRNNEKVQDQIYNSAEKVIGSKTNAIVSKAELEEKQTNFNNKKGACECFGYNEATTEKWAVNAMNIWHNVMTLIWIIVGTITFAPITFVAKKIRVIIKASWVAVLLAIVIYLIAVTSPFWIKLIEYIKNIQAFG